MSYPPTHTSNACDKCLEEVGRDKLIKVPFLYLDRNDQVHPDAIPGNPDYKQYYICSRCKP